MFKLLLITAIPAPLLAYFSLASSYTTGILFTCLVFLAFSASKWHGSRAPLAGSLRPMALVSTLLISHLAICAFQGPIDWARGLGSLVILAIFTAGALVIQKILLEVSEEDLERGLRWCLYWLGIVLLLGILGWLQPDKETWTKSLFPFSEPSHLALFLAPILVFNCVTATTSMRLVFLATTLLATSILQNVTLAAVCLLTALLSLSPRYLLLLIAAALPVLFAMDLEYYLVRLDFSGDSDNLSNLVFFQGWQLIAESWEKSHGLGLGFQQLGVFGTDSEAADLIHLIMGEYLNLLDGGFNLSKFISEFGVFGMVLIAIFLRQVLGAAKLLRAAASAKYTNPRAEIFAASCIYAYTIEIFLRGIGYFSVSGLLLTASLFIWMRRSRHAASGRKVRPLQFAQNLKPRQPPSTISLDANRLI